jgi:hypothetical protein
VNRSLKTLERRTRARAKREQLSLRDAVCPIAVERVAHVCRARQE